jgi:hypothetical protein
MHSAILVAEVFVPAVVLALLRGPLGVVYLVCAGVMRVRRRRQLHRVRRAIVRQLAPPGVQFPSEDLLRLKKLRGNESATTR